MRSLSTCIGVALVFLAALFAAEFLLSLVLADDTQEVIHHGVAIAFGMLMAGFWVVWIAGRVKPRR